MVKKVVKKQKPPKKDTPVIPPPTEKVFVGDPGPVDQPKVNEPPIEVGEGLLGGINIADAMTPITANDIRDALNKNRDTFEGFREHYTNTTDQKDLEQLNRAMNHLVMSINALTAFITLQE